MANVDERGFVCSLGILHNQLILGSVRLFLGGVSRSLKGEGHINIFWPSGRVRVVNLDAFGEGHIKNIHG